MLMEHEQGRQYNWGCAQAAGGSAGDASAR
jgi:hypothetical protein